MSIHHSIVRHLTNAPTSLADLQAATQVSLPTLRRAVQELSDSKWIRVVGQAEANGGRPAMLFGLDDRLFVIIGLHLQLPGIRLIMSDLSGNVLDEFETFNGVVPMLNEAVGAVADYITRIRAVFPERHILGIGIAAPGFIDQNTGDIITIGRVPSWGNFPFCRRLQAAVGLPVHIANDVDCMAFAEFQHTREPFEKNLAYVGFDEGVKISLFLKGGIYKGSLGNAGLIASHLLYVGGETNQEELQSLSTIMGVSRVFERRLADLESKAQIPYDHIVAATNPRERFHLIISGANSGMPLCHAIMDDMIQVFSVAIANLIYIVQPDVIVIGGLLSSMPKDLYADLESAIRGHLPELISNNSIIQQGRLASQNSASIGAIHHFMQNYLSDAQIDLI
jgi:predicted NBD/HSP70 family sugar kinase